MPDFNTQPSSLMMIAGGNARACLDDMSKRPRASPKVRAMSGSLSCATADLIYSVCSYPSRRGISRRCSHNRYPIFSAHSIDASIPVLSFKKVLTGTIGYQKTPSKESVFCWGNVKRPKASKHAPFDGVKDVRTCLVMESLDPYRFSSPGSY